MKDTDWRPTPCPRCSVMREAREHPVCGNKQCNYFGYKGDFGKKQTERTTKTEQKYVWKKRLSASEENFIVSDLTLLFKNPDFDADNDQIFELGPEVKLKMQIVTIPTHPVKRKHSWENKE